MSEPGNSRARVLASIRQSLGRSAAPTDALPPLPGPGPRPALSGDVVQRFADKMREKAATVETVDSLADVGDAVDRFVAALEAPPALCVSPALAHLAWPSRLRPEHRAARREDLTSVTPCFCAVAESGGIVTLSSPETPSTLNFVPDNHIVIVHAHQVVMHFEDAFARWRTSGRAMPRTLNIISGPSRTADIEQTIQLGAHGPRRLHVLLVAH